MLKTIFSAAIALFLSACATSPVPSGEAKRVPADRLYAFQVPPAEPHGKVIVTRDSGFSGSACTVGFYVNGTLAGKFETSETASFDMPAGEYIFGVGMPDGKGLCAFHDGDSRELDAKVVAQTAKYYRLVLRPGDTVSLEPTTVR